MDKQEVRYQQLLPLKGMPIVCVSVWCVCVCVVCVCVHVCVCVCVWCVCVCALQVWVFNINLANYIRERSERIRKSEEDKKAARKKYATPIGLA